MRLCRLLYDGQPQLGLIDPGERVLRLADVLAARGENFTPGESILDLLPGGAQHEAWQAIESQLDPRWLSEQVRGVENPRLLTPVPEPGKILLLAGNYAKHVVERGGRAEERSKTFPYVFLKPTTTLTHPGDPVRIPRISPAEIDWEIELGVIIGRRCSGVTEADALDYVAGYTVVNDISDRAFHPNPGRAKRPRDEFFDWQHGKWHDTFCPIGPCILPAVECADPQQMKLQLFVNGQIEQDGSTNEMIFPVAAIVSFISSFVTLLPGDILSTGTPDGVGKAKGKFLKPGDFVEARIEGIGTLANPIVGAEAS